MYSHLVLCLLRCAPLSEIDSGSIHAIRMRDSMRDSMTVISTQ
jgi:hypothetical protein